MIIVRIKNIAMPGCQTELAQLVKSLFEGAGLTPRVYTPTYGEPHDAVVLDIEFETGHDMLEFWANVNFPRELMDRWQEIRVPGSHVAQQFNLV